VASQRIASRRIAAARRRSGRFRGADGMAVDPTHGLGRPTRPRGGLGAALRQQQLILPMRIRPPIAMRSGERGLGESRKVAASSSARTAVTAGAGGRRSATRGREIPAYCLNRLARLPLDVADLRGRKRVSRSGTRLCVCRARGTGGEEEEGPSTSSRFDNGNNLRSLKWPSRPSLLEWRSSKYDAEIFSLAVPALLAVLLDPLMSIVDTAMIGRLGVNELAGTGLAGLIWTICTVGLFQFLATAITPLIANAKAKDDGASVRRILSTGICLAFSIASVVLLLKFSCADWVLRTVFKASDTVASNAMSYLNARAFSVHATLIQLVCVGAFRGLGDTRTILHSTLVANTLNVVLDYLFIFKFGLGVQGAAASSSISSWLSLTLLLRFLIKRGHLSAWPVPSVKDFWLEAPPIMQAGLALSLKSMVTMYTIGLASSAIARLGAASLAAHEVTKQLFFVCYFAVEPLSVAGQTMVATALGGGQRERAKGVTLRLVQLAVSFGIVMGCITFAFGPRLIHVFTKEREVVELALSVVGVVACFQPIDALMLAQEGALLGAREHVYISRSVITTSIICFLSLSTLTAFFGATYRLRSVWCCIKILSCGRALASTYRLYISKDSPILA